MQNERSAIWTLCDVLEAELEGRPYDRSKAVELATRLGEEFPAIQNSIKQICQRIGGTPAYGVQISN